MALKVKMMVKVRGEECEVSEWTEPTNPRQLASSCYLLSKGNSGMHEKKQIRELEECDCDVCITFHD